VDRPLAVLVAMDAELVHLVGDLSARSGELGGRPIYEVSVAGQPVVAVRIGIGMLNAAAATERVIAELAPSAVLNYGCAGAHRAEIMPGDVVIGERVVYHAAMNVLRDGTERHTGFGYEVAGERMHAADLAADTGWLAAAERAAKSLPLEPWPASLPWPPGHERRPPVVHRGPVASADIWTQHLERLTALHERHGSLCEDMEAAAIAHVCALHDTPFFAVKDISNNEFHAASDLHAFSDFPIAEIGKRAAAVLRATIEAYGATADA
jgi:adenosylhomocysteine nucleosidase